MTTIIRPELSTKNEYYVPKHRFYELKHFCMQYDDYKRDLRNIAYVHHSEKVPESHRIGNPTENIAMRRISLQQKIDDIKKAASITDPVIGDYILEAVKEGLSYETINARRNVPCCKAVYYTLYRKFFYILDGLRD